MTDARNGRKAADHRSRVLAHALRKFFDLRVSQCADRHRSGQAHRCPVRHRARDQRVIPQERLRVRQERIRPLIVELQTWLREQRACSPKTATRPKQSITALTAGTPSLASSMMAPLHVEQRRRTRAAAVALDERTDLRRLRRRRRRAAAIYTLIATAKLNDIDPQASCQYPDYEASGLSRHSGISQRSDY